MSSDDVRQENTYWSREMSALLQIGDSTLRKWCKVLESQGYRFLKDDAERRAFTDHDAIALRSFKELTMDKGVALDSAAKAVVERFSREALQNIALSATVSMDRYDGAMEKVLEHMQRQEEFNKALLQELADQRRYIEESLKRRDEQLIAHLRESLETQRQLAAAEAEQRAVKRWWQIWK